MSSLTVYSFSKDMFVSRPLDDSTINHDMVSAEANRKILMREWRESKIIGRGIPALILVSGTAFTRMCHSGFSRNYDVMTDVFD